MDLFSIAGKIILDDGGVSSKLDSVNSKAKSTGSTFDNVFEKVKSSVLKVGTAIGIGFGFKEAITNSYKLAESASDLSEAQNVVENTFRKSSKSVEAWTNTTAQSAGISKTAATQYSGFMGAMLKSSGIGEASSAKMSESLVQLTGDMSSFYNVSTDEMWEKIRSGISGETMPLKQLGINMDVANLSAFALSEGIKKPFKEMSQAEQTTLRYNYLLHVTKDAQGDFGRTLGTSFANQVRVAQLNLKTLGQSIGSVVLPYFMKGVSFFNTHIPQIKSIITGAISGIKATVKSVTPVIQGLFSTIQLHMPQIQQLVSHVISTVSGMVQTIKPFIQPIITDIITIAGNLLPNLSSSASGTSSVFSGVLKTALSAVKDIFDWMAQHGAAVKAAVLGIGGAFATFKTVKTITGAVSKLKNGFDKIVSIGGKVSGGFEKIASAGGKLKSGFETVALKGMYAGDKMKALGSGVSDVSQKMGGGLLSGLKKVGSGFQSLFALMAANPISIVIVAIVALVAGLVVLYNKNKAFRDLVNNVWNGIKTFFAGLPAFFAGVGNSIKATATNAWNAIKNFFTQSIPAFIASVGQWFQQLPYNIGYALGTAVKAVINFGTSIWNWVTTQLPQIIQGIIQWFQQLPGKIWDFLAQVITNISTWGTNMWNYLSRQIPKIINGIGKWFSELPGRIWTFLMQAIAKIENWGSQTYSSAVSAASNTINAIGTWFSQLPGRIWNFLTTTINNIGTWGGNMLQAAGKAAQNTVDGIINWFQQLPEKMLDIGKNIITGLWKGITGAASWLWGKITGFCGNIVKGFKDALKIHSPSQVLADEVGKFMALGVGQGFTDNMQSVSDKMTAAVGTATSGLNIGVKAQLQAAYSNSPAPTTAETVKAAVKGGNVIFNNNFYEKTPSQSEVTRQQKNMLRQLALGFNLG